MTLGSETGSGDLGIRFKGVRRAAGEGLWGRAGQAVAMAVAPHILYCNLLEAGGGGCRGGKQGRQGGACSGKGPGACPLESALPSVQTSTPGTEAQCRKKSQRPGRKQPHSLLGLDPSTWLVPGRSKGRSPPQS